MPIIGASLRFGFESGKTDFHPEQPDQALIANGGFGARTAAPRVSAGRPLSPAKGDLRGDRQKWTVRVSLQPLAPSPTNESNRPKAAFVGDAASPPVLRRGAKLQVGAYRFPRSTAYFVRTI